MTEMIDFWLVDCFGDSLTLRPFYRIFILHCLTTELDKKLIMTDRQWSYKELEISEVKQQVNNIEMFYSAMIITYHNHIHIFLSS